MATKTNSNAKRALSNDEMDLSTSHRFLAPYEILNDSFGLLQFLVSGDVFDNRSFTSLYNLSLKNGWEKIFTDARNKLVKSTSEPSIVKCLLINRLLHEYQQNSTAFTEKVNHLHAEIISRMRTDYPNWQASDLFREIERWREIERRRHLFYFDYKMYDDVSDLPSFLLLQKSMTQWCEHLIQYFQHNIREWNAQGHRRFAELFKHLCIIVAQPTGLDSQPCTHYIKDKGSFGRSAKLNARIISLVNPDVVRNCLELPNFNVTLCSAKGERAQNRLSQTPIVWETKYVTDADGHCTPIYYAEVHNLIVVHPFASRTNTTNKSSLCQLEFQTRAKVTLNLSGKNQATFEDDIKLLSEPFIISSHAHYSAESVAKVIVSKVAELAPQGKIGPELFTTYIGRYFKRKLHIEPKWQTMKFIEEILTKAFDDVRTRATNTPLKDLIEMRLNQLICQIGYCNDYPFLTIMYEDSLFLGICDGVAVDNHLRGTKEKPQILLRFGSLLKQPINANPEIQCITNDGKPGKSCFSKKSFIDDICRFIFEAAGEKAMEIPVYTGSIERFQCDYQWYNHDVLAEISTVKPPGKSDYKPLVLALWQLRTTMSELRINDSSQPPPSNLPTESPQMNIDKPTIKCIADDQDLQNSLTYFTFQISVPTAMNMNRDDIIRCLEEKLREFQHTNPIDTDSNEELPATTWSNGPMDEDFDPEISPFIDELSQDSYGPLETPNIQIDSESTLSNDLS